MTVLFALLMLSVMVVNGWTDAPNAIASCVSTRSMSPRRAVLLSALCNCAGAVTMSLINSEVAQTVYSIVDFGDDCDAALKSLCAGMCAVMIWAVIAWVFGIPTSETHALMAGITGAAIAARMSFSAINTRRWFLVLLGLALSTLPAYLASKLIYTVMTKICSHFDRRKIIRHFMRAQRWSAASSSFMHGAQDSQKFMGVFMLGISLISGNGVQSGFAIPAYVVIISSAAMTFGTLLGGSRIIKKVGSDMVSLDAAGGAASDMASSGVISVCTFLGIPVSTTHSKTCAMMGAGSGNGYGVDRDVARQMFAAWVLTFPICAVMGFLLSLLAGL